MLSAIKSTASTVGTGLLNATAAMHNASVRTKIEEIDEQSAALRQQLTRLEKDRADLVRDRIRYR